MEIFTNIEFMKEMFFLVLVTGIVSAIAVKGFDFMTSVFIVAIGEILTVEFKGTTLFGLYAQDNMITYMQSFAIVFVVLFIFALYDKYVNKETSNMYNVYIFFLVINFGMFGGVIPALAFFILYPLINFEMNLYTAAEKIARRG